MTLPAGTRLGPFEILSPLGAGGMGEVYRARDTRLGRNVAVKVLPAEVSADSGRLRRFEKEARSASSLNHPNIVTVYDIGTSDSVSYMAMELVEGITLRQMLAEGALPIKKLLALAAQVAEGLAKAHAAGIVHRDLKPENIMVTKDGLVKILDFGLAKLTQPEGESGEGTQAPTVSGGTEPGIVVGTVAYMSPEQTLGKPLDFRSDQFSFGSMLYEMVTGKKAFARATGPETMTAILREDPEPLATAAQATPVPLRWIVERCLAKEPRERYASTEDLARDLEDLRGRLSDVSGSGDAMTLPPGRRGWRVAPLVLAAGALAMLAAGLLAGRWTLGTVSSAPTFQRLTFRRGTINAARFAPDGQTIVYDAAWEGNPSELFSTRPGAAESRPLGLGRARMGALSSLGELAFFLDAKNIGGAWAGTLARAPLAGGQAREVLENVQAADWSPDGKELAIVRDVGARNRLEYPPGRVLGETADRFGAPRVSAGGDQIAVAEWTGGQVGSTASVAVVDRSGRRRSLARHDSVWGLAWSPKGDEIWFNGTRQGETRTSLFAVTLSGKERLLYSAPISLFLQDVFRDGRLLVTGLRNRRGIAARAPGETAERDLSWLDGSAVADLSADGKTLLIDESGEGGGSSETVYLRKTDGSPAKRLGEGWATALSPDGKWALTIPPGGSRLLLLPTGAGEVKTATYAGIESIHAAWSFPDGIRALLLASERGAGARLFVGDFEGRNLRAITPEGTSFYGVSISPDGKFVTAVGPDRMAMIYAVEGSAPARAVAGLSAGDTPIRFTSDGKSLFTMRLDEVPARVFRVDLATGQRHLFRELAPPDRAGLLPITVVRMTADGRSYAYNYLPLLGDLYLVDGLE